MGKGKGDAVYGYACGMSSRITIGEEATYGVPAGNYSRAYRFMSESVRLGHAVLQDPAVCGFDQVQDLLECRHQNRMADDLAFEFIQRSG